jgi:hypothetical protein
MYWGKMDALFFMSFSKMATEAKVLFFSGKGQILLL